MISAENMAKISATMKNLEKNNMAAYYVEKKQDVPKLVAELIGKGDSIAFGGSVSLAECGVMDFVRNGDYRIIDRYAPGLTREQINQVFRESFFADHYLCSTNAVTESGALYNVDGTGNRVAAMLYGPKSVILVVGYQKIVKDIDEAVERVRTVASPKNCKRLSYENSVCYQTGSCVACGEELPAACANGICHDFVVMAKQSIAGRIKVIFVGEEVGY